MIILRIQRTNIKVLSTHYVFQCYNQCIVMAPWFHTKPFLGDLENPTEEETHNRRMQIKRTKVRKS